jgi:hypothetical protein
LSVYISIKTMAAFSLSSLVFVFLSLTAATAQTRSNSPAEYFGGSDNDAYLDWSESVSRYTSSLYLPSNADPDLGAAVHWSIEGDSIFLAVAARATGWVGFGLSENGGMQGADVVLFRAAEPDKLSDSYILEERVPVKDDCQNWSLLNSKVEGDFLIFEATRLLNTGDPQDRVIMNDAAFAIAPSRIIAAWGDTPAVSYHGKNRARGAIRWFGDKDEQAVFDAAMKSGSEGSFELRALDYPIKAQETEYVDFCFSREDILAQGVPDVEKLSIVGFEAIISDDAKAMVHHFIVRGSPNTNDGQSQNCEGDFGTELAYGWATGEGPMALADNLGAPFGGVNGFQSFTLETHYNNPDRVPGVVDSSGVRFYYTTQEREFDVGVLPLGDPLVKLEGVSMASGLSSHAFRCPTSCTSLTLKPEEPLNVIRESIHMHKTGIRAVNEQIRGGEVVRAGVVDFFNFDQQGNQAVQQEPYQILAGDSFNTECFYRSPEGAEFGYSSQQEMCIVFIAYYPRQLLVGTYGIMCAYDIGFGLCEAEYSQRELSSEADLQRNFGAATECKAGSEGEEASLAKGATSNARLATRVSIIGVVSLIFFSFLI